MDIPLTSSVPQARQYCVRGLVVETGLAMLAVAVMLIFVQGPFTGLWATLMLCNMGFRAALWLRMRSLASTASLNSITTSLLLLSFTVSGGLWSLLAVPSLLLQVPQAAVFCGGPLLTALLLLAGRCIRNADAIGFIAAAFVTLVFILATVLLLGKDGTGSLVAGFVLLALAALMGLCLHLYRLHQDLKATAKSHEQAQEQMRAAGNARTDFVAHMSHELRTPLNAVIGFAEMMKTQAFGPLGHDKYTEYADSIHASGHKLLALLENILELSRIESGQIEVEERVFDWRPLLNQAATAHGQTAQEKGVTLNVEAPEAGRLMSWGDDRLIGRMISHLLSNAIKFTPMSGQVTVSANLNHQGEILLSVADTGIGMAVDEIERLLAPFARAENAMARRYEGAGLGLAKVQAIAGLHQAALHFASQLGEGCMVTVTFPAERQRTSPPEAGRQQSIYKNKLEKNQINEKAQP